MSRIFGLSMPPQVSVLPMAYTGRASSLVLSGTPVKRPRGFFSLPGEIKTDRPVRPTRKLDFEAELGFVIAQPVPHGQTIAEDMEADEIARAHLFGMLILNDWSARDIQAYESMPLGPFHGKSFCSSISPWVVPLEAFQSAESNVARQPPAMMDCPLSAAGDSSIFDIEVVVKMTR